MELLRLDQTNLEVPRVGKGGIPIQRPSTNKAIRGIQHALDLGINFIDTSIAYGANGERFGQAIAGRRDKVIIATKTVWRNKEIALKCLDLSLRRLKTDYIDLWQFHNVSNFERYKIVLKPDDGVMEAAQEALQAGKVLHVTNWSPLHEKKMCGS